MRTDVPGPTPEGAAWSTEADVWHAGRMVGTLPITTGRTVYLPGKDVAVRVDCTMPDAAGIVGAAGHEIQLWTTVHTDDTDWRFPTGRYLIVEAETIDGSTRVIGRGLLQRVADHGAALARPASDTIASTIGLILARDQLPLIVPQTLPQVPTPDGFLLGLDPWEDIATLTAAWGVTLIETPTGEVTAIPAPSAAVTSPPQVRWADGESGTLLQLRDTADRTRRANHFIVDGADGVVAEDYVHTGRLAPDTYGWVTERVSTDLPTVGEALRHARLLADAAYLSTEWWDVTVQPDWRVEPGDPVEIVHNGSSMWGRLIGYDRPLTAADGAAREQIGVPA